MSGILGPLTGQEPVKRLVPNIKEERYKFLMEEKSALIWKYKNEADEYIRQACLDQVEIDRLSDIKYFLNKLKYLSQAAYKEAQRRNLI